MSGKGACRDRPLATPSDQSGEQIASDTGIGSGFRYVPPSLAVRMWMTRGLTCRGPTPAVLLAAEWQIHSLRAANDVMVTDPLTMIKKVVTGYGFHRRTRPIGCGMGVHYEAGEPFCTGPG